MARRNRRLMNQINVVPYIDVMLVLLVIFMVTAPMVQTGTVDIPSAGTAATVSAEAVTIEVAADRTLAIRMTASSAPETVSRLELQRRLSAALTLNPDQGILIAADRTLDYQHVIDVLEAVRQLGARRVSLLTQGTGNP